MGYLLYGTPNRVQILCKIVVTEQGHIIAARMCIFALSMKGRTRGTSGNRVCALPNAVVRPQTQQLKPRMAWL